MHDILAEAAKQAGTEAGISRVSYAPWALMKPKDARKIVDGYNNNDEEVLDLCPKPLAGEWADDPTPFNVLDEIAHRADNTDSLMGADIADDTDDLLDIYEAALQEAFWNKVIPILRLILDTSND